MLQPLHHTEIAPSSNHPMLFLVILYLWAVQQTYPAIRNRFFVRYHSRNPLCICLHCHAVLSHRRPRLAISDLRYTQACHQIVKAVLYDRHSAS
ncbi:hypothetical protein BDQ17DRAFT_1353307 [Cyathus striatus]|nr:hypothetical protein BDQ17DRAFT_1353307 [Cyathus striatus]